tara:strand:+ start:149 stop:433 length:285 start_codon:yes stop_codon:yes gene_type:complete
MPSTSADFKKKFWTTEEKIQKCIVIKQKLRDFGLNTVYKDQMILLDAKIQNFVKNDEEFTGTIPLPGIQRFMDIKLRNNKKWDISVTLKMERNR